MKVLICYFSGTGNTKKVVDAFREQFEKNSCEVTLHCVEKPLEEDLHSFDLVGIAYPVHAFNAPPIIVNFVKSLPKVDNGKRLFIINTSGEPLKLNNISSIKIRKILKKKGFVLHNEYHYCMPYNMIFRHSDSMAYKMWTTASQLIPIDCKEIVSQKDVKLGRVFLGGFLAYVFRIEHWGGRFNGKKYKVNKNCIHCAKCVRDCPTHNIKIEDGHFVFGKNCIMCMRCSFMCPKNAIKIGWFNGWKVNGPYNFNNPNGTEQAKHKNFCKRSYKKYFARSEKKIAENSATA